jgi:hypothetical protein
MSNYQIRTKLMSKRLLSVLGAVLILGLLTPQLGEAFQIRQSDNLRAMQSKPYAQSANFRVDADMFIQPSLTIRSADLVTQAAAPVPPTPVLPIPGNPNGGGSGGGSVGSPRNDGGEKYDASDWVLSRKYDELVRERDGSFLTSAPEDPDLDFNYIPTDPSLVELIDEDYLEIAPPTTDQILEPEPLITTDPEPYFAPVVANQPTFDGALFQANPVRETIQLVSNNQTAEQVLINSAPQESNLMVVRLSKAQQKELLKSQSDGFRWPWQPTTAQQVEAWQSSAPNVEATQTCINCERVLWWSWCQFVVIALVLILLLVALNTLLQILMFRYRLDRFKPDNPKSLKYRLKKFLQSIGLMSVALMSFNSFEAQAQTTTTPQLLIYEGELLDDLGVPAAGSFTFRFSFWDNGDYEATDVTGGVLNAGATDYRGWNEIQTTSTLSDGSFSLQLSEVTPFTVGLFDQDNLYLQVEVKNAGDPDTAYEFVDIDLSSATVDRKIIASVPFAFNANKLDYRDLGFGAGNIPYLDVSGLLPESLLPDLNLTSTDLDLADITLSDFTNDLALNDGQVFIGDATNVAAPVTISGDGTLDNAGVFTLSLNSVSDDELDFGNVTLADFTNDAGFLTTVDISDNTNLAAGSGATLTDDTLSVNVGDTIESTEITDGTITADDLDLADITLNDFTNDAGFVTTDSDILGGLACAANEIAKWNGTIWICSPDAGGAAFTASDGITLTGSNFTNDFSTSIESSEITDGTITDEDLDLTDITLADLTNDAGFLTTVDISDNTNLAAGAGLTLTDDTLSADLGTDIDTTEIQNDAVTTDKIGGAGVNQVLTSDALGNPQWEDRSNFAISALTTDNIFVGDGLGVAADTAVTGDVTMTGGNFQIVSDAITSAEIADGSITTDDINLAGFEIGSSQITDGAVSNIDIATNAVDGSQISLSGETTGDLMYFDGTDWIVLPAGTAGQVLQVNGTADAPEWSAAAAGDFSGLSDTDFTGLTAGDFAIFDGTNWVNLPATGDITISAAGVATIVADAITGAEILDGSVDVSDDTNLTAGTGLTLIDDTLSADLGSTIDSSEIEVDTITALDIANDAITASELADDAVDTAAVLDDAITDDKIDLTDVTLADFTNDAGFVTTDNDTTYTAGSGINLIGTQINSVLGSDISTGELQDSAVNSDKIDNESIATVDIANDAVTADKIGGGGNDQVLTTDATGNTQWEDKSTFATPSLSANNIFVGSGLGVATGTAVSGDLTMTAGNFQITNDAVGQDEIDFANVTLNDFTNDAGFLTSVDISDNTNLIAGTGATLIGDTISVDLGTSIEGTEITDETIQDNDLDLDDITLNDFDNDAGFLTSVDISADTNLAVGSGLTLIGDSIISDLGDSIVSGEIVDGTITESDLNLTNITLDSFTNDTGFLDSVDISDDTNLAVGPGLSLIGDNLFIDLGDSISAGEIETDAVGEDEIDFGAVTLNDFVNDAGFITSSSDTLNDLACGINEIAKYNGAAWVCAADAGGTSYSATDGITLTGAVFTNDFGTTIESSEISNGTIQDEDLDLADVTLGDFTNDVGFVTTDTLDDLACSTGEIARWNGTAWECAGSTLQITEILTPRYPSSIFSADGSLNTGSMFEEDETLVGGYLGTVLRWFSRQVTLNDYDIIVEWTVPDDFDSFQDPGFSLDYQTNGTALDAAIDMIVQRNNDGIDELSAAGMGLNANLWTTTDFTLNGATTWVPGDVMKIRMRMKARQSNSAQVGNIKINYNKQ